MKQFLTHLAVGAAYALLTMGMTHAGPLQDARAHFQAIANGDVNATTAAYGEQPRLNRFGGLLEGKAPIKVGYILT